MVLKVNGKSIPGFRIKHGSAGSDLESVVFNGRLWSLTERLKGEDFPGKDSGIKIVLNPVYELIAVLINHRHVKVIRSKDNRVMWTHTCFSQKRGLSKIDDRSHENKIIGICWRPNGRELAIINNQLYCEILEFQQGNVKGQLDLCVEKNEEQSGRTKAPCVELVADFSMKWVNLCGKPKELMKGGMVTKDIEKGNETDALIFLTTKGNIHVYIDGCYKLKVAKIKLGSEMVGRAESVRILDVKPGSCLRTLYIKALVQNHAQDQDLLEFEKKLQVGSMTYREEHKKVGSKNSMLCLYKCETEIAKAVGKLHLKTAKSSRILERFYRLKLGIQKCHELYKQFEDETLKLRRVNELFLHVMIDNGLENTLSMYSELIRMVVTGKSSEATISFFLSKFQENEIKTSMGEMSFISETLVKTVITDIQRTLEELLVDVTGSLNDRTENHQEDCKTIQSTLIWLYERYEWLIENLNTRYREYKTMYEYLIYVKKELEWQNSYEPGNDGTFLRDRPELPTINRSVLGKIIKKLLYTPKYTDVDKTKSKKRQSDRNMSVFDELIAGFYDAANESDTNLLIKHFFTIADETEQNFDMQMSSTDDRQRFRVEFVKLYFQQLAQQGDMHESIQAARNAGLHTRIGNSALILEEVLPKAQFHSKAVLVSALNSLVRSNPGITEDSEPDDIKKILMVPSQDESLDYLGNRLNEFLFTSVPELKEIVLCGNLLQSHHPCTNLDSKTNLSAFHIGAVSDDLGCDFVISRKIQDKNEVAASLESLADSVYMVCCETYKNIDQCNDTLASTNNASRNFNLLSITPLQSNNTGVKGGPYNPVVLLLNGENCGGKKRADTLPAISSQLFLPLENLGLKAFTLIERAGAVYLLGLLKIQGDDCCWLVSIDILDLAKTSEHCISNGGTVDSDVHNLSSTLSKLKDFEALNVRLASRLDLFKTDSDIRICTSSDIHGGTSCCSVHEKTIRVCVVDFSSGNYVLFALLDEV